MRLALYCGVRRSPIHDVQAVWLIAEYCDGRLIMYDAEFRGANCQCVFNEMWHKIDVNPTARCGKVIEDLVRAASAGRHPL